MLLVSLALLLALLLAILRIALACDSQTWLVLSVGVEIGRAGKHTEVLVIALVVAVTAIAAAVVLVLLVVLIESLACAILRIEPLGLLVVLLLLILPKSPTKGLTRLESLSGGLERSSARSEGTLGSSRVHVELLLGLLGEVLVLSSRIVLPRVEVRHGGDGNILLV